jgi:BirA family biotin operon repressor/biotin-[acetyl-CoA-carboxylase] ligase
MIPREEWRLPTQRLGRRVLLFDRLDSTSTCAAAMSGDPSNDGLVVIADEQSAGRGRQGRSWQCPPGQGLLLSALLFAPEQLRRAVILTAWAAVAVCRTIERHAGLEPRIKWPNDVLVRERKVGGILIEQSRATVAGIGLNLNQSAEAFVDLPQAGSLALFAGRAFDRKELAVALIQELDESYDELWRGHFSGLEAAWVERLNLVDRIAEMECVGFAHRGRIVRISFDGLEAEEASGSRRALLPEQILHVVPRDS